MKKILSMNALFKSLFLLFWMGGGTISVFAQVPTDPAGPDNTNCNGTGIKIGISDPCINCCYNWWPETDLDNSTIQQPTANPLTTTEYSVTVTGDKFAFEKTDKAWVFVVDSVIFKEDASMLYGYDDWTDPNLHWKSVGIGKTDVVNVEIWPMVDDSYKGVYYKSTSTANATVSPNKAGSSSHNLTITGGVKGNADIEANCGKESGTNLEKIKVAAYRNTMKSLAIVRVIEDNDDVQTILIGRGQPNQPAVTPGANGILNSVAGGDDVVLPDGSAITTGPNGVCNSARGGDDIQVIPPGRGKPNAPCVAIGANGFRDSILSGDDTSAGDNMPVTTGPDGLCNTVANNVDIVNQQFSIPMIMNYLNQSAFNQALESWTVVQLPDVQVNYDLDRNGGYDDADPFMSTLETQIIRDACQDLNYNANIFFVDNPDFPGGLGQMGYSQRFGFVNVGNHFGTTSVTNTVAHELGHGAHGLQHPGPAASACGGHDPTSNFQDPQNIMDYCNNPRFRKFQWDIINP